MEFDAVKPDAPISKEQPADYWREKAECLEEWVCELLIKNQALRMDLEKEQLKDRRREEATPASSLLSIYQPPIPSARLAFRTESPEFDAAIGPGPPPRSECAEVRELVIRSVVMNQFILAANN